MGRLECEDRFLCGIELAESIEGKGAVAGIRQGALAIMETPHDARVVVIEAGGSIEVRAGPEASAS